MERAKRKVGRPKKLQTESANIDISKTPNSRGRPKKSSASTTKNQTPVISTKKNRPVRNVRKSYILNSPYSDNEDTDGTHSTDQSMDESNKTQNDSNASETNADYSEDLQGKQIFGCQSSKNRSGVTGMTSKLNSKVLITPKLQSNQPTTPYTLRKKQNDFSKLLDNEDDEDFSGSDDNEFIPKGSSSESEDQNSSESDSANENNSNPDPTNCTESSASTSNNKTNIAKSQLRGKNEQFVMKSDDYFSWQASSKIVTSNHTLQKLKNPKLSEDELQNLLMACSLNQSKEHERSIHEMVKLNCCNFNKWLYILHEGFNVLLYGLGSKRNILRTFQTEMLTNSAVIVVNGFFPSLTIKDVADSILLDVFNKTASPGNVFEAVNIIKEQCSRLKNEHFYLIVHNIDGPMLRNHKSQAVLSSLADIPNMHLLASVDHINTPLIWDHSKLSKFNFTWWDATSFLPYTDETSFENSMLVQRSGALALSSLSNVYQSLTKNSKGVFMLIVKYQLKNKSVKYYPGMPFKVLYSQCRENFLVSSDLVLRTQLTEFLDHKLVKSKRAPDGVEQLSIPLNHSLLQQFLEQTHH